MRNLVSAQLLAEGADGIVTAALPLYVYAETGSAVLMTTATAVQLLGGAVGGMFGGVLADRHDRQQVLRWSYVARAVLLLAAGLVPAVGVVVACAVAARALGQVDNPSFDALMASLATDGDVQQVMSLRRFVQSVSVIVGPAIGALLVWVIGEQSTFVAAAGSFFGAVAVLALLRGIDASLTERRAHHDGQRWTAMVRATTVVVTTPVVRRLTAYWVLEIVAVALSMGAAVVWFEETLGVAGSWYGISMSAWGIGSALGTLAFAGRRFTMPLQRILLLSAPVYAACCVLSVLVEQVWVMPVAWLLWGIAYGPEIVSGDPVFVAHLRPEQLGRAYAGLGVALMLGMSFGYAIAGPLIEGVGPRTTTLIAAALILATALMWVRPDRRLAPAPAPAPAELARAETEMTVAR